MILEAIFAVGTLIITEFVRSAAQEVIRNWVNSRSQASQARSSSNQDSSQQKYSSNNNKTSQNVTNDIEFIDAQVVELERKERRDGYTSKQDQELKQRLESLRINKFNDYQEVKAREIAKEQSTNPENYETSALEKDKVHVLQYHMGQLVLEKKCLSPYCRRPMILQSKSHLDGSLYQLDDFFWSCSGFYSYPQCRATQKFQSNDIGFLHKANIFEFQLSNQDFSTIFNENSVKKVTVERVKSHLKEKDQEVLCPTHYIPMVLREKKQHSGFVLDMFFLACPHAGCNQIVKLKSPAQLAAYLNRKEGRGIL